MRKDIDALSFSRLQLAYMIGYYGENGAVCFVTDVGNRDFEYYDHEMKFFSFGEDSADKFASISSFTIAPCLMVEVNNHIYLGVLKRDETETCDHKNPFAILKADHINAPLVEEMPIVFECEKNRIEGMDILGAYIYADIENISVSPTILNEDGTVSIQKMLSEIHFVKVRD